VEGIHIYHSIYSWGTVEQIPRLGDVQVHGRLYTAKYTGKLILNVNHRKPPINVQLMSFYRIHQIKSAISNLPTKISTYLSSPEVFHKPARVVTNTTGSPSSLYESHQEHNMASNYKGLYGIFYKISMKVDKSEKFNKNGLPYSIRVLFAPGVVILPI